MKALPGGTLTRQRQKIIERICLREFLECAGLPPPPDPLPDRERPDFILHNPHSIGIEVTELYISDNVLGSRPWEGSCEAILDCAMKLWKEAQLPGVHVGVTFDTKHRIPKADRHSWAKLLVDTVKEALPKTEAQVIVGRGPEWLLSPVPSPVGVKTINIQRHDKPELTLWTLGTGGVLQELSREYLQGRIDAKNPDIRHYPDGISQFWLLFVAGYGYSGMFRGDSSAYSSEYRTDFHRVYVFERIHRKITILKLLAP